MNRSETRENAFRLLYSFQLIKDLDYKEQLEIYINEENITDKDAVKYITDIVEGIKKNDKEIEDVISQNIKEEWTIDRINKVNLTNDSTVKVTSGDVVIGETNDIYIDAHVVSGDVKVNTNNRKSDYELKINTTSGDIIVNN